MNRKLEQFKIRMTDLQRSEEREFVGGRNFGLGYGAISDFLLLPLTSRMIDLLRIASSIYFVDRLVKRDRKHGPESWCRKIACSIEVRELEFWSNPSVQDVLQEAVNFVSGDEWDFEFVESVVSNGFEYEWQRPLQFDSSTEPKRVCLYSGGLDSAAGLAKRLLDVPETATLAVNVQHRTDLGHCVTEQLRVLSREFKADLRPVVIPFEMDTPKSFAGREETSQRTRSFLFVAAGGIIAGATGASELELYESGIGALNAPLLAGMEGSQATRSAHPKFLELMSGLLSLVVSRRIDVTLPFRNSTKGDVVKSLDSDSLREIARSTISCAHYPVRLEKGGTWKSCGLCPACIFRRVALHSAGISEASEGYQHDLLDPRTSRLSPKKLRYLIAYLLQVDSFAVLDQGRLPSVISRHLRNTEVLLPGDSQQVYVDLFQRYRSEWHNLLGHARRNGCDWAHRIDVSLQAA
jgi:7-cyano-7-deazaguanine synthase in queuosine biosynthesis